MDICRYCFSSDIGLSATDERYYHCAGCDRDDLTADDLLDEDELIESVGDDHDTELCWNCGKYISDGGARYCVACRYGIL